MATARKDNEVCRSLVSKAREHIFVKGAAINGKAIQDLLQPTSAVPIEVSKTVF